MQHEQENNEDKISSDGDTPMKRLKSGGEMDSVSVGVWSVRGDPTEEVLAQLRSNSQSCKERRWGHLRLREGRGELRSLGHEGSLVVEAERGRGEGWELTQTGTPLWGW